MIHSNQIALRKNLDEVSFIRPILIIILVLYHAFAPWCGAWKAPESLEPNEVYWWVGKTAYSFMLPMFVFISGYVWAYQREILLKKETLKSLVTKKFKRLYIPSLIFGVAYLLIFDFEKLIGGGNQLGASLLRVISGYAHMWFLPMLFWIFIFTYLILQIKKRYIRWIFVLTLCAASMAPFPLCIDRSFFYIIYFYAGYETLLLHTKSKKEYSLWMVVLTWLLFALLFVFFTMVAKSFDSWYSTGGTIQKAMGDVISNLATKIYGFAGITALFITSLRYTKRKQLNNLTIEVGEYCFGVYLFQQFVLKLMYKSSFFIDNVNQWWIPWLAFVLALSISLGCSYILRKCRIGRFLIG